MPARATTEHRRPRPLRFRRSSIAISSHCRDHIERGALIAINSSGSKYSQAMTILLSRMVPREQLLIVHAPLGRVEWPGTMEHIERTMPAGVPFILAPVASGESLLERFQARGLWCDPRRRWYMSGHKADPIS